MIFLFHLGSFAPPVSIFHSDISFCFTNRRDVELSVCDRSVAHNCVGLNDVLNDGRRQGIVKKFWKTEKARSKICRLEIAKSVFQLFEKCSNLLPTNLKVLLAPKSLKYCDLKSACHRDNCDNILKSFFPSSQTRIERRNKLDRFQIVELKVFDRKQKVILLSGTQGGDSKSDDSGGFFEALRKSGFDVRKIPVLKIEVCNQVCYTKAFYI